MTCRLLSRLVEKYGSAAHHQITVNGDEADHEDINVVQLAKDRRREKTCSQLHPGLCRHSEAAVVNECKRVAKQIYDLSATLEPLLGFSVSCSVTAAWRIQ